MFIAATTTTTNDCYVITEQQASTGIVKCKLTNDADQWQAFVITAMMLLGRQQQAIRWLPPK
jgi:hypothetical protein